MKYKKKAKLISNIQTTFQSFHCKVASYTKSKPKKVNESRLKKIIENESVTSAKFEIIKRYI